MQKERKTLARALAAVAAFYRAEGRPLPWRRDREAYHIFLSEIMLQQTRVEAVKPYFECFMRELPDVKSLAEVPEEKLLKLWEGLGYYSRARNLQKAARQVCDEYGGELPADPAQLQRLCGIGAYTAGAIASIAFGRRAPAVDGNVMRVWARLTADGRDILQPAVQKAAREDVAAIIPADRAGDFTQALIELGATVCAPNREPMCDVCPLRDHCAAYREGKTQDIPVRSPKKPRRVEERTVFLIRDGDRTALHKRPPKGLLSGLYELPNVEGHLGEDEVLQHLRSLGFEPLRIQKIESAKHIFTHIEWHMIAYDVLITPEFDGLHGRSGMLLVPNQELHRNYAIPSAFGAYVKYL